MTDAPSTYEAKLHLLREYQAEQLKGAWQECNFALLSVVACDDDAADLAMQRLVVFLAESVKTATEIAKRKAAHGEAGDGRSA